MISKSNRLLKEKDFRTVAQKGRYSNGLRLNIKIYKTNSLLSRFAFITSLKVSKKAVIRNKIRRRLREVVRLSFKDIRPGYDVMIIAKPEAAKAGYLELRDELLGLLKKAKIC